MKSKYTFNEIEELLDKTSKLKISDVTVSDLLTNGKKIATIHIDNFDHNLYAPSTYAWSEITSKPTTLAGYGITDAIRHQNGIVLADVPYNVIGYGYDAHGWLSSGPALSVGIAEGYLMQIQSSNKDGSLYHRHVNAGTPFSWYKLLDERNYDSVLDTVYAPYNAAGYLPLSGGTITGNLQIGSNDNTAFNYFLLVRSGKALRINCHGTSGVIDYGSYSNGTFTSKHALSFSDYGLQYKVSGTIYNVLHAGNYSNYALPLTGGTLKLDSYSSLFFQRNGAGISAVGYSNNNGVLGYIGVAADAAPIFMSATGTQNTLLHEGNYESIVGNKFLKLSGGMINTGDIAGLTIYRNNSKYSMIHFCNNEGNGLVDVGYLGIVGEGVPVYLNSGGSQFNLLHSGNFYSYAPTLTGTGASGTWGIDISGRAAGFKTEYVNNLDNASENKFFHSGFQATNRPSGQNYATGLTLLNNELKYAYQLAFDTYGNAYVRYKNTTDWQAWKTLAFTDSTVAGAYTLKNTAGVSVAYVDANGFFYIGDGIYTDTSLKLIGKNIYLASGASATNGLILNSSGNVTIGANDLAGTYSYSPKLFVDGYVAIPNGGAICTLNASGVNYANLIQLSSNNVFYVGGSMAHLGYDTVIRGNNIKFQYGASHTASMVINSSGNVTIGDEDYAGSNYKLFVHGEGRVSGGLSCIGLCGTRPTLGSAPSSGFIVDAYGKNTYGLSVWLENSGQSFIQSGRFAGDAIAYALNLQPLGGVVNVGGRLLVNGATDDGTTSLQVNGDIRVTGNIIADGQVSSGQSITFVDANGNNHVLS